MVHPTLPAIPATPGHLKHLPALCLLGLGWIALYVVTTAAMPIPDRTISLGTLVFAEALGVVLWASAQRPKAAIPTLTGIFAPWLLACAGIAGLFQLSILPFYQNGPMPLACLAVLALLTALLRWCAVCGPRWIAVVLQARLLFLAAAVLLLAEFAEMDAALMLSLAVFCGLALLALCSGLIQGRAVSDEPLAPALRSSWHSYADFLILPLFLAGPDALAYLLARGLAQLPITGAALVEEAAQQSLADAVAGQDPRGFVASAARLNLGLLLVGGGLSVAAITLHGFLPVAEAHGSVAAWVVLGASAPAIFGAGGVMLGAMGLDRLSLLQRLTPLAALVVIGLALPAISAPTLAMGYAASHLVPAALGAASLARRASVWPGATAVFFGGIRIF